MLQDRVGSAAEELQGQFQSLYQQTFTPANESSLHLFSNRAAVLKPKAPFADTMILRILSKIRPGSMEADLMRFRRHTDSSTLIGRYHRIQHLFEPYVNSIDVLDKPMNYQVSKDELDSNAFVSVSLRKSEKSWG